MIGARKLARELGINERTMRRYIKRGLVRAVKIKNRWVIPTDEEKRIREAFELAKKLLPIVYPALWLALTKESIKEIKESLG